MAEEEGENPEHRQPSATSSGMSESETSTLDRRRRLSKSLKEDHEAVSPLALGLHKEVDDFKLDGNHTTRNLQARPHTMSRWLSQHHYVHSPEASPSPVPSTGRASVQNDEAHTAKSIVAQAWDWLHTEKQKRRLRRRHSKKSSGSLGIIEEDAKPSNSKTRRDSSDSDTSNALEELEEILKKGTGLSGIPRRQTSRRKSRSLRKSPSLKIRMHSTTGGSSDTGTDQVEPDIQVSTCEAWLDNSRTLSRTAGLSAVDETGTQCSKTMSKRERDAWSDFQFEILRIAHTLQLRRWRRVPLERSQDIVVERLSGALTNAVYTVSPPKDIGRGNAGTHEDERSSELQPRSTTQPTKLLLRIYGPQVEHLIDRDAELQILRRLGRQNIGPRLLGTFHNGRFEEYLHAQPLKPVDLRQPEVSKQIAKRMRELHDGIELTKQERKAGPFIWRNWDKWVSRCERIVSYIDNQIHSNTKATPAIRRMRARGFVCGTSWPKFKETVDRYREELVQVYGGADRLRQELIFSHNDTQYGNILRQEPPGESPLLLPANVHKQLVVIDFEYSNANTRGLEFANHFTEWCYNYHHPDLSFECQTSYYPMPEEQRRFVRAYLEHRPQYTLAVNTPRPGPVRSTTSSTSTIGPPSRTSSFSPLETQASNSTVSSFKLNDPQIPLRSNSSVSSIDGPNPDARGSTRTMLEQSELDREIARLMYETRLWRIANTAQWIAWGIVQARVPGLHNEPHEQIVRDSATDWTENVASDSDVGEANSEEEEDKEFDYLSYARSRAMFFWGDCVQQGLITEDELPEDVRGKLKIVNY